MNKKFSVLLLSLFLVAGCNGGNSSSSSESSKSTQTSSSVTKDSSSTNKESSSSLNQDSSKPSSSSSKDNSSSTTKEESSSSSSSNSSSSSSSSSSESSSSSPTIEGEVLDNNGYGPLHKEEITLEESTLISDVIIQINPLENVDSETNENLQKRDVRLIAAINSNDYEEIGFEVQITNENETVNTTTYQVSDVYGGMEVNNELKSVSDIFGENYNYIVTYELKDIPVTSYDFEYSVTAYVKNSDETTKSSNVNKFVVSEVAFGDMVALSSTSFTFTVATGYNTTWLSLGWSESDSNIPAANIDFTKDVYYRLTLNDDSVLYYDKGNSTCHQNGATDNVFGVNCEFIELNTSEGFKKIEIIINNDGELNYGYIEFNQLPTLENVSVSEDYILTFDELDNVASYKVKIYNDTYSGEEVAIKSNDKLPVATLKEGTYNIDITAVGNFGYTNSVTTLENAFTIETVQEVLNAPVGAYTFDFDRVGRGNAWETPVKITWTDDKYAATSANSISDFGLYAGGAKVCTLSASDNYNNDYYSDYYGIYFFTGRDYDTTATTVYSLRFYITTDSGQVYYVHHKFFVGLIEGTTNNDRDFIQEGTDAYNTKIQALVDSGASLTTYNEFVASSNCEIQDTNYTNYAIDGNESTRWASAWIDEVELVIDLNGTYNISSLSLLWEGACGENYTIEVSSDGINYTVVQTVEGNATFGSYLDYTLDAENVSYIKINCTKRATEYGYSIYELKIFGTEVTA